MGVCFLHGMRGGSSAADGTGLNILYGEERPETAEENTIWIGSSEAASGSCVISPSAPEGVQGLVWLKTGDSGLFVTTQGPAKAVFYLWDALLYQDGSWTPIAEAGIYQNGAWILFCESRLVFMENGIRHSEITGGFTGGGVYADFDTSTPTYYNDRVVFASHTTKRDMMCAVNRFILDRYSKVVVDWYVVRSIASKPNDTLALSVFDVTKEKIIATVTYGPQSPRKKDTLDIKDLTGEYYIAVHSVALSSSTSEIQMSAEVYSLELQV